MKAKPQPRRVQLIHKAIALNAAAGNMADAHAAWDMAPVRYRAVMSLMMWQGRLKRCSSRRAVREPARDPSGLMIVQQDSVKEALC